MKESTKYKIPKDMQGICEDIHKITDILVNAPASMVAAIGLWGMRRYGYMASQFVAGFYIYASVEIFVEVVQAGPPFSIEIVMPQILAVTTAIVLVFYLWRIRKMFGWQ